MLKNLIAFAGLSHSGKDLLFGQLMKLGSLEPELNIYHNVVYYDWIVNPFMQKKGAYTENLLPAVYDKILTKLNTLIYIHDITYQRLDDTIQDFQQIISNIETKNKEFQVVLLLNRGHLITNEVEKNNLKDEITNRLQTIFPQKLLVYIVSLKGADEQRRTNLIFTQIMNKAKEFETQAKEDNSKSLISLEERKKNQITKILNKRMNELNFSGAYLLSNSHRILFALGKSQGWQEKVGPQIIKMLDKNNAFDIAPKVNTNILRIEDFLMVTQTLTSEIKLVLIGRESNFTVNSMAYSAVEEVCNEISNDIGTVLN